MNKPQNILIARTDRIGDVILTLPAAAVIKKHFPECRVSFLLREYTKDLAANNPYIDEVIVLKENKGKPAFFSNYRLIKGKNFDTVLSVYPRIKLALIYLLAGIKTRAGSGYRWYSFLFNKKIYEHRKYGNKHELTHNINLLKLIGIDETVTEESVEYGLSAGEDIKSKVKDALIKAGIDLSLPVIIFHPGSRGSAVDLPLVKMKELVKKTAALGNLNIILTGDSREFDICATFPAEKNIFNLCGKFNLAELIALAGFADILVANSTGPIHIAAALGKYVIGFYPKIKAQSPARWAPFTEKKKIFVPPINCSNCTRKQCEELNCMNNISIDEVFMSIKEILERRIK